LKPHEFFGIAFWIGFTLHLIAAEFWINYTRRGYAVGGADEPAGSLRISRSI
jgi:hypothetical protein